jgi:hypothetical protein
MQLPLGIHIDSVKKEMDKGAIFSECRQYRYALWRIWDPTKPIAMIIGLNPSTANETESDNTIKRLEGMVYDWKYGGFYMMNLFAIVSPDPSILKTHPDPVGKNDGWIQEIAKKCHRVIFAWGNFKEATARSKAVIDMFPDAYALYINKNGSPKHPLYCSRNTKPVPYRRKAVDQ